MLAAYWEWFPLCIRYPRKVIRLTHLDIRFDGTTALSVEHLELPPGQLLAVMGPNGAGKTTLLRVLAGLLHPNVGATCTLPGHIAYVRQDPRQHSWMPMTAREVVHMGRYQRTGLLRRFSRTDREHVAQAVELLEVKELLDRPFQLLSGGQRQRVLIAAALASDAPLLLMDEPITGLDLHCQRIIKGVAQSERDSGRTVIFTTHHVEEAQMSDRVLLLNTEVTADGTPEEVLAPGPLSRAFGQRVLQAPSHDGITTVLVADHGHHHHPTTAHCDDESEANASSVTSIFGG